MNQNKIWMRIKEVCSHGQMNLMNLYKEKIIKIKLLRNKLNFKQQKNNKSKNGVKINSITWIKSCLN